MTREARGGLLKGIDTWTKVLALVGLIAEALFLGSVAALPSDQTLYALITCAVILVVIVLGIVFLESKSTDSRESDPRLETTDQNNFAHIEGRRKALAGKWSGTLKQQFRGAWGTVAIEMEFKAEGRIIEGIVIFDHPEGRSKPRQHLKVINSFFHEPILKLDCRSTTDSVLQFGCWIARLNAEGTLLEGRYVAYGSLSDRITFGEVCVSKQA
jgi:hypothetical protein